jgi:hypothetical protein
MHMLDWNSYRQQLAAAVGSLGRLQAGPPKGRSFRQKGP